MTFEECTRVVIHLREAAEGATRALAVVGEEQLARLAQLEKLRDELLRLHEAYLGLVAALEEACSSAAYRQ